MRFPGIRLVEQTEQISSLRVCLKERKKTSDCNSRALLLIKAPSKKQNDPTWLTLSWPGKIWFHPKIGCFNFKPQYLLNYTSPTNDLYSVRKRSIGAFKSIFKLLGLGAKFSAGVKTLHASCLCLLLSMFQNWGRFDPMLIPVG